MANPETFADQPAFLRDGGAMGKLIATHDWASTSLGPLESWPSALKAAISTVLSSSLAVCLRAGEDSIALYNDAFAALIGVRHPASLGASTWENWPELAALTAQAVAAAKRGERLSFRDLELTVVRNGVPEPAWMNIDCSPLRDETGAWLGLMSVAVETTERVLAERKAQLQSDHLRSMFEQAPGFICLLGGPPDYTVEYVNAAHKQMFGDRAAEGRPYLAAFSDVADVGRPEVVFDAFTTGQPYLGRGDSVLVPLPDGGFEERFVDVVVQPLRDAAGEVTGLYVEGFDVTSLVRAQQAVEETARRLSAAVTVARLGIFELIPETREARLDARAREIFGFGPHERIMIADLIARMDEQDLDRMAQADAAVMAAGEKRQVAEYRIHLPDGSTREISAVGDLTRGPDGPPLWSIGLLEDITERRRADQRQRMLINELNHRVKNTLATVQSIASQTLRSAPDPVQARAAFEARLMALSAAHDLLTAQSWHGARLDDVAASALAPFEAVQAPQVTRSGAPVWLTAPVALALSLALHELATNAAKYGALSVPEGRVRLQWILRGRELAFTWSEEGGPPVATPVRSGFGMRLLQRNLARELGGDVAVDFAPEGMRCAIRFAVQDRAPPAGARANAAPADVLESFWEAQTGAGLKRFAPG
jgi:two-component sensor histidine kinase/PAS domain-containing protein